MLVYTMRNENYRVSINPGGDVILVYTVIPQEFYALKRAHKANKWKAQFNQNTNIATSYRNTVRKVEKELNENGEYVGEPMNIALPIKCIPEVYNWEIQVFEGGDKILNRILGINSVPQYQYFFVLTIERMREGKKFKRKKEKFAFVMTMNMILRLISTMMG